MCSAEVRGQGSGVSCRSTHTKHFRIWKTFLQLLSDSLSSLSASLKHWHVAAILFLSSIFLPPVKEKTSHSYWIQSLSRTHWARHWQNKWWQKQTHFHCFWMETFRPTPALTPPSHPGTFSLSPAFTTPTHTRALSQQIHTLSVHTHPEAGHQSVSPSLCGSDRCKPAGEQTADKSYR